MITTSQKHRYPASMANLPIDLTNQQSDKQAILQQKHADMTQKVESLKKIKEKLVQRKATLQAMNSIKK